MRKFFRKAGRKNIRKGGNKRAPAKAKGVFKKKVLQVIHEQLEDKHAFASQTTTNYNGTIDSTAEFYDLCPSIPQGTDMGNRIGDQIRGKNLVVKGHICMSLTGDSDANTRIAVRLMALSSKIGPSYYSNENNTALDRLLLANSTAQKFNGDVLSLYLPVNREMWTVHYDKIHYLSMSQLYHTGATDVEVTRETRYTTKFFTIRIPCKKLIRYGDGHAWPTNFRPRFCLGYAHVDGSTADTVETQVAATWISDFTYEDA